MKGQKELDFVTDVYAPGRFDPERARRRFRGRHDASGARRRWLTALAGAVSVAVAFAGGYGIRSISKKATPAPGTEIIRTTLNPDVATTHVFIYDAAPLPEVLSELSAYYGCRLTTGAEGKVLTATFPDDDIDFIVSLIEQALEIDIDIER